MKTLILILVGILLMTLTEPGFKANHSVAGAIFLVGGLLAGLGLLRVAQIVFRTRDPVHPWRDDVKHPRLSYLSFLWDLIVGLARRK